MASKITMPKLSDTMEKGVILRWLKKEGDRVSPGEMLAEVETDKANMELELFEGGVVRKLLAAEGTGVPIGAAIAILGSSPDEDVSALLAEVGGGKAGKPAPGKGAAGPGDPSPPPAAAGAGTAGASTATPGPGAQGSARILSSPVARRLAEERGIPLGSLKGTGPGGRVVKRDVLAAAPVVEAGPATAVPEAAASRIPSSSSFEAAPPRRIPLGSMRQIIARRMVESKFQAPHFYVTMDVDMAPVVRFRESLKAAGLAVSLNDIVLKAVAGALVQVPEMNGTFSGDTITRHGDAHVGFAVAFEGGLLTPVIRFANRKSLGAIAAETADLIARAKKKKLKPEEYTGGTFTVSNMGMYGIEEFTAIINTPEIAILAVGGMRDEPVVEGGAIVPGKRMKVTVSTDHRAADGADASRFLVEFRKTLQTPALLAW